MQKVSPTRITSAQFPTIAQMSCRHRWPQRQKQESVWPMDFSMMSSWPMGVMPKEIWSLEEWTYRGDIKNVTPIEDEGSQGSLLLSVRSLTDTQMSCQMGSWGPRQSNWFRQKVFPTQCCLADKWAARRKEKMSVWGLGEVKVSRRRKAMLLKKRELAKRSLRRWKVTPTFLAPSVEYEKLGMKSSWQAKVSAKDKEISVREKELDKRSFR